MSDQISLILVQNDYQNLLELLSNKTQFDFLRTNIVDGTYGRKYLKMSREQNESIIEELFNLFTEKGLKSDNEPNNLGYLIESMIDTVGKHLHE